MIHTALVTAVAAVLMVAPALMSGLPAYQGRTLRAQNSEANTLTSEPKTRLLEHYRARGEFPHDNADGGVPKPSTCSATTSIALMSPTARSTCVSATRSTSTSNASC